MSDEVTNTENAEVEDNGNPTAESADNKSKQEQPKTFTQGEVNQIVSKEKKSVERKLTDAQKSWETEKQDFENRVSNLEKILTEMLASEIDGLPDLQKKFIDKLALEDKISYLKELSKEDNKTFVPSTPKANKQPQSKKQTVPKI